MSTNRETKRRSVRAAIITLTAAVLGLFIASSARAQEVCDVPELPLCHENATSRNDWWSARHTWSAAGSTGAVDEVSRDKYAFVRGEAYVKPNQTGTVILRYPVACTSSVDFFNITYKDDGANARVRAKLVVAPLSGIEMTMAEFDSDERPSGSGFQSFVQDLRPEPNANEFFDLPSILVDCGSATWYVEVRLTRAPGGDPRLKMLGLKRVSDDT